MNQIDFDDYIRNLRQKIQSFFSLPMRDAETLEGDLKMIMASYALDNVTGDLDELGQLGTIHQASLPKLLQSDVKLSDDEARTCINLYLENLKSELEKNNLLMTVAQIQKPAAPQVKHTQKYHIDSLESAIKFFNDYLKKNKYELSQENILELDAQDNSWLAQVMIDYQRSFIWNKLTTVSHPTHTNVFTSTMIKAISVMSYEEVMLVLLDYNQKTENSFILEVLQNKLTIDPVFAKRFSEDTGYAPFLAKANVLIGNAYPIIRDKPVNTAFAEDLIRQDLQTDHNDLIKISLFLTDEKKVLQQLLRLEQVLNERAIKLGLNEEGKGLNQKEARRFLQNYFKEWLKENGFEYTKLEKDMPENEFASLLSSQTLFKDKQLGGKYHGEWTHVIQWWCIVEVNRSERFLNHTPQENYKNLGSQSIDIWYRTFESAAGNKSKTGKIDFRDVDTLNKYLLDEKFADKCPLLHRVLHHVMERRETKKLMGAKPQCP